MNTDRLSLIHLIIFCFSLIILGCQPSYSQTNIELTTWGESYNQPVAMFPWTGDDFILIEKSGKVKTIDEEGNQMAVVLDIGNKIADASGERGLLGVALHPMYPDSPYIYLNHTDNENGTAVVRYIFHPDSSSIDPATRKILLTIDQPYSNHNGGCIVFGPDGYLYIGMGDGGSGGDPENRAQNLNSLLGKILRIDVDQGEKYGIPEDNPFVNNPDASDEIWSYGWRNPWRFSFDRQNGDMWVGDVGQNDVEEISYEPADSAGGLNYGWRCFEGDQSYDQTEDCDGPFVDPIITRNHDTGDRSITGGYRYRGPVQELHNLYIFADFGSGYQYMAVLNESDSLSVDTLVTFGSDKSIASFAEDKEGNLYALELNGQMYKIILSCDIAVPELQMQSSGRYAIGVENDSLYQQYIWYFSDSSDQKQDFMAVDTTDSPVYYDIEDGNYYVTAVDSNGCQADSDILNVIISSTNAMDFYDIKINPNPASDHLTIVTEKVLPQARIEIRNSNGQLIKSLESSLPGTLPLVNIPSGVYFLKFLVGQKYYAAKVVKK